MLGKVAAVLTSVVLGVPFAYGESAIECDRAKSATKNQHKADGYRYHAERGHCEGFYLQPISSISGVDVVAFQYGDLIDQSAIDISKRDGNEIYLTPVPLGAYAGEFQIKGSSQDPAIYYQIDKVLEARSSFSWNTESVQLAADRNIFPIGFFACTGRCSDSKSQLVPIRTSCSAGTSDGLKIVLQARASLSMVYYELTTNDGRAQYEAQAFSGRLPPRRTVTIVLPAEVAASPGAYDLTVYAVTSNGQTDVLNTELLIPASCGS